MINDFIYLDISTFGGMCPGAIHYYANLIGNNSKGKYTKIKLTKRLTTKEAKKLNELDCSNYRHKSGDETYRFNSPQDLINKAKRIWKKHFPNAKTLIEGRSGIVEPQKVLAGELKKEINKLFTQAEKIGGWDLGKDDEYEEICKEWKKIVQ